MKFKIDNTYYSEPFTEFEDRREELLGLIDSATDVKSYDEGQSSYNQSNITLSPITRLDWHKGQDHKSRPWVNFLKKAILWKLHEMCYKIGYQGILLRDIWFQQYKQGSSHDWHIHSYNFTGAYYVELPEEESFNNKTEIYDGQKILVPNVKQGDICIFPATTFHRAPIIESDQRKTIISYNFDVKGIRNHHYDNLKIYKPVLVGNKNI
jgi:hypothetical protein